MPRRSPLVALSLAIATMSALPVILGSSSPPRDNPQELGRVRWGRDVDAALAASLQTGKPVFLQFQEVPGCQGCKDFGDQPLSHPLLVEAIEGAFIPVAIHNNKGGYDAQIVKRFAEREWNYPVARFLNADGKDIIPRQESVFSVHAISGRMIEALTTAGRDVPASLRLAMMESDVRREHRETITFAMHCFWEGEGQLGGLDGVITTRAGFLDGREVVQVRYDPTVLPADRLIKAAERFQCASKVYAHRESQLQQLKALAGDRAELATGDMNDAPASDQKHSLRATALRWLPLTPMQATKVNAAIHQGDDPKAFLSPGQTELLKEISASIDQKPDALKGLTPPESVDSLGEYEDTLRARLARQ